MVIVLVDGYLEFHGLQYMLISEYLVLHKCFIELIKLCCTSFCLAPEASRDVQVL